MKMFAVAGYHAVACDAYIGLILGLLDDNSGISSFCP